MAGRTHCPTRSSSRTAIRESIPAAGNSSSRWPGCWACRCVPVPPRSREAFHPGRFVSPSSATCAAGHRYCPGRSGSRPGRRAGAPPTTPGPRRGRAQADEGLPAGQRCDRNRGPGRSAPDRPPTPRARRPPPVWRWVLATISPTAMIRSLMRSGATPAAAGVLGRKRTGCRQVVLVGQRSSVAGDRLERLVVACRKHRPGVITSAGAAGPVPNQRRMGEFRGRRYVSQSHVKCAHDDHGQIRERMIDQRLVPDRLATVRRGPAVPACLDEAADRLAAMGVRESTDGRDDPGRVGPDRSHVGPVEATVRAVEIVPQQVQGRAGAAMRAGAPPSCSRNALAQLARSAAPS